MNDDTEVDQRRYSSLFAYPTPPPDAVGPYGRPAYLTPTTNPNTADNSLLVDFPNGRSDGLEDMECDDDVDPMDSSSASNNNPSQPPRKGEAARAQELMNSQDLPGGLNHRPLVGGFAAAAYEAAKAHHYSSVDPSNPGTGQGKERTMPPSI